jgi:hypothetical protein
MFAIITPAMMTRGCFVTSAGPIASLLGTAGLLLAESSRRSSSTVALPLARALASAIGEPDERATINYHLPERPLFRRNFSARTIAYMTRRVRWCFSSDFMASLTLATR